MPWRLFVSSGAALHRKDQLLNKKLSGMQLNRTKTRLFGFSFLAAAIPMFYSTCAYFGLGRQALSETVGRDALSYGLQAGVGFFIVLPLSAAAAGMGLLYLVAGFGVLSLQRWSRWLAVVIGGVGLPFHLLMLAVSGWTFPQAIAWTLLVAVTTWDLFVLWYFLRTPIHQEKPEAAEIVLPS